VVVSLEATGPPQPWIALVEETAPLLFRITRVPQNAKEVLVEPVLLYIRKVNVLYTESPDVQVLQRSVPGKVALTNVRSLEVQEEAAGNVVVVWVKACEENKQIDRKRTSRFLTITSYQALDLGDKLLVWVKGWFINNCLRLRNYDNSILMVTRSIIFIAILYRTAINAGA
jgi:hypothetical protein